MGRGFLIKMGMDMTYHYNTYEFTALTMDDLRPGERQLDCGETFTMPGDASVCFSVHDNDPYLSGDCWDQATDHSGQQASIMGDNGEVGNGHQIYAESFFWVQDSGHNWYLLIEIEQEGSHEKYYTFHEAYGVPSEGTELKVKHECNVSGNWIDYKCLDAGDKEETGSISGTVFCDTDCDGLSAKVEIEPGCDYTIEAENMHSWGFHEFHSTSASNGAGVKLGWGCYETGKGDLWTTFNGKEGEYDLKLFVQDENDGCSIVKIKVNGHVVDTIYLDENTDGHGNDNGAFSEVLVEGLDLKPGDEISLWADGKGSEFVRIDKIELEGKDREVIVDEPVKEGVEIKLIDAATGDVVATTLTDADGNYSFDDVPVGDYKIMGVAPDGQEFTIQDVGSDDSIDSDVDENGMSGVVSVTAGSNTDIDLGLKEIKTGSLSGRYFCDDDDDAVESAGDSSIAGATVILLDSNGNEVARTTTGTDGVYRFDDVEAGDYSVLFEAPNAIAGQEGKVFVAPNEGGDEAVDSDVEIVSAAGGETAAVTVVANEETTDVDAGIVDPGTSSISGRYFCDENDNDIDDGEPGIVRATVTARDADGNVAGTAITNANGEYTISGLKAGAYTVEFSADPTGKEFVAQDDPNGNGDDTNDSDVDETGTTEPVTVGIDEDVTDVDAGVETVTATISGRYFCDENGDNTELNSNGLDVGVAGATVVLLQNGVVVQTTDTNSNGDYTFEGVEPGSGYQVLFQDPAGTGNPMKVFVEGDFGDQDAIDSDVLTINDDGAGLTASFDVAPGDAITDVDAGIVREVGTGQIGDTVWLDVFADGVLNDDAVDPFFNGVEQGVADVTVQLKDAATGTVIEEQTTDASGNYLFTELPAGNYIIGFIAPEGFEFTAQDAGGDDARDSDADQTTGMTDVIVLGDGESILTVDAGLLRCGLIEGTSQADENSPVGGYDLIEGCETNDTIIGFSGEDTLNGNGGDDRIEGGSFDDLINGGAGADVLRGGEDNDVIIGGLGDDDIRGEEGFDTAVFSGNLADATITVTNIFTGELEVTTADGTDRIREVEALRFDDVEVNLDEVLPGGTADAVAAPAAGGSVNIDVLANDAELSEGTLEVAAVNGGAFGTVQIEADGTVTYTADADFAGYDFFTYTVSNGLGFLNTVEVAVGDLPRPEAGDPGVVVLADFLGEDGDTFTGTNAADSVLGGIGYDNIVLGNGNDVADGGRGEDVIRGGGADDLLLGGDGDDAINADNGDDVLLGENGDDRLIGQVSDDVMFGGQGDDGMRGQDGSDFMAGGTGDDTFTQLRSGSDIALGGAGADTFVWNEAQDGAERDLIDGESGIDRLTITLDAGTDAVAVQAEIDAYFADAAINTPSGGTITDGALLYAYSFTTIELDIANIEDIILN